MYTEIAFGDFLDWNGATETTIFLANVLSIFQQHKCINLRTPPV